MTMIKKNAIGTLNLDTALSALLANLTAAGFWLLDISGMTIGYAENLTLFEALLKKWGFVDVEAAALD